VAQELMEAEVSELIGARHGERTEDRATHRNGYRPRRWDTRAGEIELQVPTARLLAEAHELAAHESASPPLPADTPLPGFLVRCWKARCWALLEPAKGVALYDDLLRGWPHAVGRRDGSLYQSRLAIACAASGQLDRARAEGRKALTTCPRDAERDRGPRASPAPRPPALLTPRGPSAARTEAQPRSRPHSRARYSTSRCPARAATGQFRCRSPRRNRLFAAAPAPSAARSGAHKPSTTFRFRT
jgi:hypothetical protein